MKTASEINAVVKAKYNEWIDRKTVMIEVDRITEQLFKWASEGHYNEFNHEGWECQNGGTIECNFFGDKFVEVCKELEKQGFKVSTKAVPNNNRLIWVQWGPDKD